MISRRDPNFHRVYDLRERMLERALPGWEDALAPSYEEVRRSLALKAVRALGVAVARWVPTTSARRRGGSQIYSTSSPPKALFCAPDRGRARLRSPRRTRGSRRLPPRASCGLL